MKFKYTPYDDINFWLALSPMTDYKGAYGLFFELFRRRIEIRWRKSKNIRDAEYGKN